MRSSAVVMGLAFTAYQTLNNTMLMSEADPEYYGRVMSIMMMSFSGMSLIAAPLGLLHAAQVETDFRQTQLAYVAAIVWLCLAVRDQDERKRAVCQHPTHKFVAYRPGAVARQSHDDFAGR